MALIQLTHDPILNSSAQVLILPVNTAGITLDPVLMRCKTLYPDNYQRYYRACRDSSLMVGSCLIHKRMLEHVGLPASPNSNQPTYIANIAVSDHAYHPARELWLQNALTDLQQQLLPLIRYQGVRRIALLTRPLIFVNEPAIPESSVSDDAISRVPLDWHSITLPLIKAKLQYLPNVTIDCHIPRNVPLA